MITVQQLPNPNIAEIHVQGPVGADDYKSAKSALEHLSEQGALSVLATVDRVDLLAPVVRWEGALPPHILSKLARVAIVSDERWADDVMHAVDPALYGKLHHFSLGQRQHALSWLGVTS